MTGKVTIAGLQALKAEGRKSVCVVAWDYQLARIAEAAGADIISVGDSVGRHLWGRADEREITLDELLVVARAVRRGVSRALLSVDVPPGTAPAAAVRLAAEAGADLVKLDGAAPDAVEAVTRAGVPVFAGTGSVAGARRMEAAGAVALNFPGSGPVAGPAVVAAVRIPVLGGLGGGPWLDGRIRRATTAIGYAAHNVGASPDAYANVAQVAFDALTRYGDDVRAGRQVRGG